MGENPFEFLEYLPAEKVIPIAYYGILLLEHRDYPEGVHVGLSNELTPETESRALDIIRYIEDREGAPVGELDESVAAAYIERLTDLILERAEIEFGGDEFRAQQLLKELRISSSLHTGPRRFSAND